MAKLLRIQDRILLVLAAFFDLSEELFPPRYDHLYESLHGWTPSNYRKENLFQAVYRSIASGNIEKVVKNGKPYFRLTGAGKKKLLRDFPALRFARKKWNGKWVVVLFDVVEEERWTRDHLRRKLVELGFGQYQRSVYISPHSKLAQDLAEFLELSGLKKYVQVMVGPWFLLEDEKALAEKVFNLDEINNEYLELIENLEYREGEIKEKDKKKFIKNLRSRYLEILIKDPLLPKDLLPDNWKGEEAHRSISSLK